MQVNDLHKRVLAAWTAMHDNGWMTAVVENPNGTYSAWAAPNADVVSVDYMEDTPEHARIAALFALKRKSGHAECSPRCSRFEMRTHTMLVAP